MEKILYLAHSEADGRLAGIALEALAAALKLSKEIPGSSLAVGLIGGDVKAAGQSIAGCGATRFLFVSGDAFASSRYVSDAAAAEALVQRAEATLVLAPMTSRFARALPGAAQRCGGRVDTQATALFMEGQQPGIERWFYRQRMVGRLTRNQRPWFILIAGGVFEPCQGPAAEVAFESVDVQLPQARTRVAGEQVSATQAQTIRPDAELLFVAGAGWTKKQADGAIHAAEAESLILNFLERSQASLGSSKSLVDQSGEGQQVLSFMSHLNQVGQTGSTPRHSKGLSTCCHGEEPHVVGWRFIKERRAVNLDPGCGWARGKADVLYVADAFQLVAAVNDLLD